MEKYLEQRIGESIRRLDEPFKNILGMIATDKLRGGELWLVREIGNAKKDTKIGDLDKVTFDDYLDAYDRLF